MPRTSRTAPASCIDPHRFDQHLFGTTTISGKGQVVIPANARAALGLARGEKLLVMALPNGMLGLAKLTTVEALAEGLTKFQQLVRGLSKGKVPGGLAKKLPRKPGGARRAS